MKVQDTIKKETGIIAAATAVMTAVMLGVFAALGYFDSAAVIGACIGACAAILDFFLLGITVQKAAEIQAAHPVKPEPQSGQQEDEKDEGEEKPGFSDPETAKLIRKKVRLSYYGRRLMLVAFACTGLLKSVNLAAVVVPMLFPKLFIQARNITGQLPKGVIKK